MVSIPLKNVKLQTTNQMIIMWLCVLSYLLKSFWFILGVLKISRSSIRISIVMEHQEYEWNHQMVLPFLLGDSQSHKNECVLAACWRSSLQSWTPPWDFISHHSPIKKSDGSPISGAMFNLKPMIYQWIRLRKNINRKPWIHTIRCGVSCTLPPKIQC